MRLPTLPEVDWTASAPTRRSALASCVTVASGYDSTAGYFASLFSQLVPVRADGPPPVQDHARPPGPQGGRRRPLPHHMAELRGELVPGQRLLHIRENRIDAVTTSEPGDELEISAVQE